MLRPGVSSPMVMVDDSGWFTSAGLIDYNKSVSYCKVKVIKNPNSKNTCKLTECVFRLSPIKTTKLKSFLKVHAKNRDLDSVSIWNRTSNCIYLENPFKPVMRFNSIKSHSKETIFDSFEFDNQLCQAASKEIISKVNSDRVSSIISIMDSSPG